MDKNSTLYKLIGMHTNGIINGIAEQDEDNQTLIQKLTNTPTG